MLAPLLPLALSAFIVARPDTVDAPRDVVRQALVAVEGERLAPVRAHWSSRLERDAGDRAALLGMATLARLTFDYATADRLYPRLFGADSLHPDAYAAYARLGLAWSEEERGRSDAAGDGFARARVAAEAAGERAAEAEALIGLAFSRGSTAGMAAALAMLDTAATLIPPGALDLQAERGWRRAMVLGVLADPHATAEAVASVALARETGDLRIEAQAYRGLARVLDWRGQDDSSLTAFREAEWRFRRVHDRSWLAVTLMNRANTLRKRGDLGATMEALHQTVAEGQASDNLWAVASAHTGLGVVALQLGDLESGAEHLHRAVAMFEAQGDRSSAMSARKFLPLVALARNDFATARRETLEARAFYQGTGETLDQFGEDQTLATIGMRQRDWMAAERALADAQGLLGKLDGRQWSAALTGDRGRLALARGDLPAAKRLFERLLGALDSAQHLSRYDARLRLADVAAQRGALDAAEREATAAWDELDRWRATLTDRELRLLAFQLAPNENQVAPANLSEQRASVARVLGALATGGRAAQAFELAERRRARELRDRLMRAQALRTDSAGVPRAESPALRDARLSAEEVGALLPDDQTAILEYVTGGLGAPTTLFVLRRPAPHGVAVHAYRLPPADSLAGEIARFLALLLRGEDGGLGRTFGRALLEPGVADLGAAVTRLIVVPDGPLHRVPWDLLRLADGRYVVERYAVSVAPSAAILAALWRLPRNAALADDSAPLLAFGDPAYAPGDSATGLVRLPASGREARLVSRYSDDAEVRLRAKASASYLEHAPLARFRVVHFAAHAVVDDRSATRTLLALAPEGRNDGIVGPGDLASLKLSADLVVLSGCRTAGGVVVEGEGIQGLTAPLIQAGAHSVVATQWHIADQSTVAFIQAFYQALAEGLPVGDALRAAKLDALRRGAPAREWAAFVTVGDPTVRVALRMPRSTPWRSAVLLATLALGAGGVVYARRRQIRDTSSPRT